MTPKFMNKQKILITGSGGQLGNDFQRILTERNMNFIAPDEKSCDITDRNSMTRILDAVNPDILINCAAYNAVDDAEDNADTAYLVNSSAPGLLAGLCHERKILFIHYSSDYVFDGKKEGLYTEEDETNPLNIYGKSKLSGEEAARAKTYNCLIFRLSWVFGPGKQNFLYKLSQWAQNNLILKISADETSVPTYTGDIVETTLMSIDRGLRGLFHLTNSGYASRYEVAKYFIRQAGYKNLVIPVPMNTFKTKAQRAGFSAMSNERLSKELNYSIPIWEEGVSRYIRFAMRK